MHEKMHGDGEVKGNTHSNGLSNTQGEQHSADSTTVNNVEQHPRFPRALPRGTDTSSFLQLDGPGLAVLRKYRIPNVKTEPSGVQMEIHSALEIVRRISRQAQVTGGLVALVVTIVMCIVSTNGVVVAIATIVSGMTVSQFTTRHAIRKNDARRETERRASLRSGTPQEPAATTLAS